MSEKLSVDFAIRTECGDKAENADMADICVPDNELLFSKGIVAAIADGMSTSEGGKQAAEVCVKGFLTDYMSTPESWTVQTSATKILGALNHWLFSTGQSRYDSCKGMVTTFSGIVLKSTTAHVFHVGDSRIYRFQDNTLEQLTRDHRVWVSSDREFLSRAMGVDPHVDIDYRSIAIEVGDIFVFVTDGVTGHLTDNRINHLIQEHGDNLQACANILVEESLKNGSNDNVTCQLLKINSLAAITEDELLKQILELPFPPSLRAGVTIDDYKLLKEIYASKRSEVFLALDTVRDRKVILKTPSPELRDDPVYLESFLNEEWVGKRLNNPHIIKMCEVSGRRFLYNISEYIEGQTLRQWMDDHKQTHINKVRDFVTQIAEGLRAFHRREMLHLDLKPENIMISSDGILKIIDLGSTRVAGTDEITRSFSNNVPQATADYAAPESIDGHCSNRSDIFSLGVITYELLTGELPYGDSPNPEKARKHAYIDACNANENIQNWVNGALKKAVHPDGKKRYSTLSEFLYDLSHPNEKLEYTEFKPFIKRNPVLFWQLVSGGLFGMVLVLLYLLFAG